MKEYFGIDWEATDCDNSPDATTNEINCTIHGHFYPCESVEFEDINA